MMTDEDGVMLRVTDESVGVTFRVKLDEKVPKMEEKNKRLGKACLCRLIFCS